VAAVDTMQARIADLSMHDTVELHIQLAQHVRSSARLHSIHALVTACTALQQHLRQLAGQHGILGPHVVAQGGVGLSLGQAAALCWACGVLYQRTASTTVQATSGTANHGSVSSRQDVHSQSPSSLQQLAGGNHRRRRVWHLPAAHGSIRRTHAVGTTAALHMLLADCAAWAAMQALAGGRLHVCMPGATSMKLQYSSVLGAGAGYHGSSSSSNSSALQPHTHSSLPHLARLAWGLATIRDVHLPAR
jgi:hypothetical protein